MRRKGAVFALAKRFSGARSVPTQELRGRFPTRFLSGLEPAKLTSLERSTVCGFGGNENGTEGEKRLQDKGSASRSLLSVCLHILFLRDRVSLERDRLETNGGNRPLCGAYREQRPGPFPYHRSVAVGLVIGALFS